MKLTALPLAVAASGLLATACGASPDPRAPDAGGLPAGPDAGAAGQFAFYVSDICRGTAGDLDALQTVLQVDATGLITKNAPDPEAPWCQQPTNQTFTLSDARDSFSAGGSFQYDLQGNRLVLTASVHASAPASTEGYFAQAQAGFTELDVRGGGGGISKVRITVGCSGSVDKTDNGLPRIHVEQCSGEAICSLSPTIPGLPGGWQPGAEASFEGDTTSPSSVLACVRVRFSAMAANLASAQAAGSVVITVDPIP